MTSLSVAQVVGWKPEALSEASTGLGTARDAVESQVGQVKSALSALEGAWEGPTADSAFGRIRTEIATGYDVVDALDAARKALDGGARDIGSTRTALLAALSDAGKDGFTVGPDGTVTPPTLPPVMTSPEDAASAAAARDSQQRALNSEAARRAAAITRALQSVADADQRTADTLTSVQIPQSLESAVRAYVQRLEKSHDWMGSLGAAGAGAASLGMALKKGFALFGKSKAYVNWFRNSTQPISDYATFVKNMDAADAAMNELRLGAANGGVSRFLVGADAARGLGKVFLPLTVLTGAHDAFTGGGYDGARGWATRGLGAAGAVGAGALLLDAAPIAVALGPVGLAVAGGAVLAYGAWSAGNYIWDHRKQIGHFVSKAADWVGDRGKEISQTIDKGIQVGKDLVSHAASGVEHAVENTGKGILHVASFGIF
ncbi:hypothetical protein EV189_0036 [Motilibacter rhizosphaerae]|uniref:Uncharacterized protein n=1 Tax=Motilibacter rhizosphaerae TaxID=598652 RepID=A0A4Q7NUG7_9ACTN|nr:hypothetical protein [Motilibacter rhizosphaerae]RZS90807.1 hypothetical protein EV189_0036 [Motilibacter rhizosphaerae]